MMDDSLDAVAAVKAYCDANPDDPSVVEFRAAITALREIAEGFDGVL